MGFKGMWLKGHSEVIRLTKWSSLNDYIYWCAHWVKYRLIRPLISTEIIAKQLTHRITMCVCWSLITSFIQLSRVLGPISSLPWAKTELPTFLSVVKCLNHWATTVLNYCSHHWHIKHVNLWIKKNFRKIHWLIF